MERRLIIILTAVSLVACLAVVVLWVRSYTWMDSARYSHGDDEYSVYSRYGYLHCMRLSFARMEQALSGRRMFGSTRQTPFGSAFEDDHGLMVGGFGFVRFSSGARPTPLWTLTVPMWSLLLVAMVGLLPWSIGARKRRLRLRRGHCLKCGYDLRGSTERCPECGTPIAEEQALIAVDSTVPQVLSNVWLLWLAVASILALLMELGWEVLVRRAATADASRWTADMAGYVAGVLDAFFALCLLCFALLGVLRLTRIFARFVGRNL